MVIKGFRIGGPDACIVSHHSTPWMARLVKDGSRRKILDLIPENAKMDKDGKIDARTQWEFRFDTYPGLGNPHYLRSHQCGGSLISRNLVITAAHCVCFEWERSEVLPNGKRTPECSTWKILSVLLGDHDIEYEEREQIFKIQKSIVHDRWKGGRILRYSLKLER